MNKSGLVDEVKDRLDVSRSRAKTLVETVLDEMRNAVAEGQSLSLRGTGLHARQAARRDLGQRDRPTCEPAPTEPDRRPVRPAARPGRGRGCRRRGRAAAAGPAGRAIDLRVLPTMPEPELQVEPDTLAYSSGEADTDETIGDLIAHRD